MDMFNLELIKKEYPFAQHSFGIDSLSMNYIDEGSGEPVVMLHGNPTWSFYYRNLVAPLRTGRRIVVPDHIGCGLSSKPQSYNYSLANHVDNLTRLINHLSLKNITLVLHDWGGAIGMGYAVKHPENIKRIVVFNTAAFLSPNIPPSINFCRTPILGELVTRGLNGFLGSGVHFGFGMENSERFTPEVKEGYLAPYRSWHDRIAIARFVQDIPMSMEHPTYQLLLSIEERLGLLKEKPMQIIWGMKDFCFTEKFLERWINYFPTAEVHRMEDAGHWVVEDSIEKIIPLIEGFLKRD